MAKRNSAGDPEALRRLYELVDDRDAIAALDRELMGQTKTIQTDR